MHQRARFRFVTACLLVAGCSAEASHPAAVSGHPPGTQAVTVRATARPHIVVKILGSDLLPGMPPPLDPHDIYAADRPGALSPTVRDFRPLVYVPDSESASVDVVDPLTERIVEHFTTGTNPQHITPSYDLKTLFVLNDRANEVTEIDPATGRPGRIIPVTDPYNMYFTPDGRYAVVVAEALRRLDFRDPHTMALRFSLPTPGCRGIDHADFSGDGRYAIFSCEFNGRLIKIDMVGHRVLGTLNLAGRSSPQDVKTAPDGHTMYVADQDANGVWLINGDTFTVTGFIATGLGAHGLYVSRDSQHLYVTNRLGQSVSVVSFAQRAVVATWNIPNGTPDMGGLSTDGNTLWLSGRYSREVYAIDTRTGKLLARIHVGIQPHGPCIYPQPGRYSLGHTGVFR